MQKPIIFHIIQSQAVGGGMENIFLEYSQILQQNNFDLICLVPPKFCHLAGLRKSQIKVEFFNPVGHYDILAAIKLHFLVRKYSPKIILAHNGRAFATINLYRKIFNLNCPIVGVSHGGNIKRLMNFDYVIAVAKHIENKFKNSTFKGIIKTIYNGYKISDFQKNRLNQPLTFGILSRLSQEKNIDLAIKSFQKFNQEINPNSYLTIAGQGDQIENLTKLSQDLKISDKVNFIGWVADKEKFFNQIDIFLQPASNEPFGMTILESFNYQTPVIAANAAGPQEIIEDNYNGYLFDPKIKDSLFLTIKKAVIDQDNHFEITQHAHKSLAEKFSYDIMSKQLLEFIEQLT